MLWVWSFGWWRHRPIHWTDFVAQSFMRF